MIKLFGQYVRGATILLAVVEFIVIALAFYATAWWFQPYLVQWSNSQGLIGSVAVPTALTWILVYALGAYEGSVQDALESVAHRFAVAFLLAFAATELLGHLELIQNARLQVSVGSFALAYMLLLATRLALRYGIDTETFRPRALILGAGQGAERLHRLWREQDLRSISLFGFATLAGTAQPISNRIPPRLIHRDISALADFAAENAISEIVIALDDRRGVLDTRVLLDCRFSGINITEASSFYEREAGQVDLDHLYPSWLIYSDGFRRNWLTDPMKRLFDIVISLTFIVWTSWIWVITALLIKLDSPGPILYRQVRVGLHGKPFEVLKFRSMRTDAEKHGPQFARSNDARVTRVGKVIRKIRVDEFPQALNVLRGDMSFVGPRPERPHWVAQFEADIPFYGDRHQVKPGITGWAQINYPYGENMEDARQKLTFDLYYMKNYSLFLDLVIILKTMNTVVWKVGSR